MGQVSPDGRWLAYASDEGGPYGVWVQPFSPGKPVKDRWPISTGDGRDPRWSADSRELFYVTASRKMMAVDVGTSGDQFTVRPPHELFANMPYATELNTISRYEVSKDGQRFLPRQLPST